MDRIKQIEIEMKVARIDLADFFEAKDYKWIAKTADKLDRLTVEYNELMEVDQLQDESDAERMVE